MKKSVSLLPEGEEKIILEIFNFSKISLFENFAIHCNRLCDLQWKQPSESLDLLQPSLRVVRILDP